MRMTFELKHDEIIKLLKDHIEEKTQGLVNEVRVVVRSKQNYKAVWEFCDLIVLNKEAIETHNENFPKDKYPEIAACVEVFK